MHLDCLPKRLGHRWRGLAEGAAPRGWRVSQWELAGEGTVPGSLTEKRLGSTARSVLGQQACAKAREASSAMISKERGWSLTLPGIHRAVGLEKWPGLRPHSAFGSGVAGDARGFKEQNGATYALCSLRVWCGVGS